MYEIYTIYHFSHSVYNFNVINCFSVIYDSISKQRRGREEAFSSRIYSYKEFDPSSERIQSPIFIQHDFHKNISIKIYLDINILYIHKTTFDANKVAI